MARRQWTGRATEHLPRAPIRAIVNQLIAEREDRRFSSDEQRLADGRSGREILVDELAASGQYTKAAAERRIYEITKGKQPTLYRSTIEKILTALDLNHLWYTEPTLARLMPKSDRQSREQELIEHDRTCAKCQRRIDWSKPVAGVRVSIHFRGRGRWPLWWSWCAICAAEELPVPSRPDVTARNCRKIPDDDVRRLYKAYVLQGVGVNVVAASIYKGYGYSSPASCAAALTHVWHEMGLPTRSRRDSKIANRKVRPRMGKLTKKQVQQAYVVYTRGQLSLRELGKRMYQQLGYSNDKSCAMALSTAFDDFGLAKRDRIEETVRVSTKSGLWVRGPEGRRRRAAAGLNVQTGKPYQQRCTHPGCKKKRMVGFETCVYHDPVRGPELLARLAEQRKRSPKQNPANLTTYGTLEEELEAFIAWAGSRREAARLLAQQLGVKNGDQYLRNKPDRKVTLDTARKLRAAIAAATTPATSIAA